MVTFALGVPLWMILHPYAGIPLAVSGWAMFVLVSPYRECRWCKNRKGRCWRCKGRRQTRRLGAKWVHKVKLSLRQAWEEREWLCSSWSGSGYHRRRSPPWRP